MGAASALLRSWRVKEGAETCLSCQLTCLPSAPAWPLPPLASSPALNTLTPLRHPRFQLFRTKRVEQCNGTQTAWQKEVSWREVWQGHPRMDVLGCLQDYSEHGMVRPRGGTALAQSHTASRANPLFGAQVSAFISGSIHPSRWVPSTDCTSTDVQAHCCSYSQERGWERRGV